MDRDAIGLMREIRDEFQTPATPMVISGCVGPRGDGYQVELGDEPGAGGAAIMRRRFALIAMPGPISSPPSP